MLLAWWLRIQRYSVRHLTPSAEPWPLWLPSASSSGSLGCGTVTIPVHTQMEGCSSKSGEEEKRKVHVWTWDVHASALFILQMHSSSLKTVIYMEMKEQCRAKKIIVFYTSFFHTVEDFIARIYSTTCITHLSLAFIWSNEAVALLLSFWKSFKPIF